MNYNLLEEKWIPVLYRAGTTARVNIIEAFAQSDRIRDIAASNPMDRVAILRLLLALLYWCKGNPPDDKEKISSLPPDWFGLLDNNKDSFNLLGDGKRFYQDRTAKRPRPVTVLIQETPAGNNFWHFHHATDNVSGLCPSCCAIGLLRLPLFSVSGLSGPGEPNLMAGINGVPPMYIVPWGKSLLQALLANWTQRANLGQPSWIHPFDAHCSDADVPLLSGLTLVPRRVYLHDPVLGRGACTNCALGKAPLILTCQYQTAGKQENKYWNDPHALYLKGEGSKAIRAADLTSAGKFRMDRPWLDSVAQLIEGGNPSLALEIGFATNKAKNIDVWERTLNLPSPHSLPNGSVNLVKKWGVEGRVLEKRIERITKSKVEGSALVSAVRPHVEVKVSGRMRDLITCGGDAWQRAAEEYVPMMAAVAKSLSPGYTTAALRRRREIAKVKPDMRLKTTTGRRPGRKTGEYK